LKVFCGLALAGSLFLPPVLSAHAAPARDTAASEYSIQAWQTEDGLPQNLVTAVIQSQEGYLWFGTYHGLVRFDGVSFRVFDAVNTAGLRNSRVTSLFEDDTGTIWIGHETGDLTRLKNGEFESVDFDPAWSGGAIASISADEHQDLWILGERRLLLRLRDRLRISPAPRQSGSPSGSPSLARDDSNRLWLMYGGAVNLVRSNALVPISFGSPDPRAFFEKVCGSRDGGLWVIGEGRVRTWKGDRWVGDWGGYEWDNSFITALHETTSGSLLVGTINQGLFVLTASGAKFGVNRSSGLPQDWVRCLTEDREGNIWVGTSGGLAILRPRKVVMLAPPNGFMGSPALGTTQGRDGSIWVGTEGAGLYRLKDGAWTSFGPAQGLQNRYVWSVFEDSAGRVWAGTWAGGVYASDGGEFKIPGALSSLREPVAALAEAPAGTLWIGTGVGLMRFAEGNLQSYAELGGPAAADVRAICCNPNGTVWIGTSGGGLGRLQGNTLTRFTKRDGLASQFILSLHWDEDRTLWIGTIENGLCRFKDGRFSTVTTQHGLPSKSIGQIADDGKGNFWLGTQRGLCRVSKRELQQCADGRALSLDCITYGKEEGLATLVCSAGFQPNHFESKDGRLFIPTAKGIAEVEESDTRTNSVPPAVILEEVMVEGRLAKIKSGIVTHFSDSGLSAGMNPPGIEVPPGQSRIEIHFTGISYTAPERVRFKYTLQGLEPTWSETENRSVNYGYLPPGDYLFRVIARNSDGLWNGSGASLAIRVLPQFWQTWWFKGFAAVFVVGTVAGGVFLDSRRRMRGKMEREARQRAIERERARIARDIHDDLGASLTRITMLSQTVRSELDDPAKVATNVDQIYSTARELTRSMEEIVWATSPRHDTLESLITYLGRYAQGFLSAAAIRCRLDEPVNLPAWVLTSEVRHNVFLAFKEALNNVVKHAAASEVRISLELKPDGFMLAVADNGRGFNWDRLSEAEAQATRVARSTGGNGLSNMQKRLEEVGGCCGWDTAPGEGTRVKLLVVVKT
jgi:ligand-binding sensor domain-containing protein/signal transduction histidine kinase